jgi:ferric-dicitrate binding protein FerR (iron transport regulator)
MASPNDDELIYRQGVRMAELIHKSREKEPLSEEEQQELNNWLTGNISNKTLFESLHNREQLSAEVKTLLHYDENAAVAAIFKELNERPPSVVRKKKMMIRRWSVAASLLGIVGVASWFFIQRNTPSQVIEDPLPIAYKTVTTPPGGQQHLQLPDGSEVWLNTTSSIRYPPNFNDDTREVTITGEAYFKVATLRLRSGQKKPFVVTAGAMQVEVTGTEFNVMAYADEDTIRTTLLEGSIKVTNRESAFARASADKSANPDESGQAVKRERPGEFSAVLKPGEQAVLSRGHSPLIIDHSPDIRTVTAWKNGFFHFNNEDIQAIMRQVARWYDIKVEYRGSVAGIGFTGRITRTKHLQDVLDILSDTRNVHFELKDNKTVVVIPGPR